MKLIIEDSVLLPDKVKRNCPVRISQTLAVESAFAETSKLPLSAKSIVIRECPKRVCLHVPVLTSHTLMDASSEPLTTFLPSNCEKRVEREFSMNYK